jgi:hypothetical protein
MAKPTQKHKKITGGHMPKRESQKTEYKSSWQEEYFEWINGYANAKGGKLYIGVNDDGYLPIAEHLKTHVLAPGEKGHFGSGEKGQFQAG